MEKIVEKSFKMKVIQELNDLNRSNVQFYALLRKLQEFDQLNNQTAHQRLEAIRVDLRDKIKNLASNVDLLYQLLDKKISLILSQVHQFSGNDSIIEKKIMQYENRIKEMQENNIFLKDRYQVIIEQNQQLKQKNILLIEQLNSTPRKYVATTNDSNQSQEKSRTYSKREKDDIVSFQNRLTSNDLTFNQKPGRNGYEKDYKSIRSEENSFSSVLIRQQNSFQPSSGHAQSSSKFGFGCIPRKKDQYQLEKKLSNQGIKVLNQDKNQLGNKNKNIQSNIKQDQGHRLQFLISNLREAHQTTQTSQRSFMRNEVCSHEKSVLSRGVVKKYI